MSSSTSQRRARSTIAPRLVAALTAGLLAVGASIVFAPPAFAATVTVGSLEYETDPLTLEASVSGHAVGNTDTDIVIPGSIVVGTDTYTVTSVTGNAFFSVGLTSVVIGDSVVTIANDAFRDNATLASVIIGNSVETIGGASFSGATLTALVIPDSVVTIGSDAFRGSPLTVLALGASVESIGGAAFLDAVLTTLDLPDSLVSIGVDNFRNSSLTALVIPDSVVSIGNNAFFTNPLTSLTLGNSLNTVGNEAFRGHELTSLVIPASVTQIGFNAFLSSSPDNLASVVMQGAAPTIVAASANGSFGDAAGKIVYYPVAFAAQYVSPWEEYMTAPGATVSFDLDGNGSAIEAVTVIPGQSVAAPADPTATGYTFVGWFTASDYATAFDFGALLEAGASVAFAEWVAAGAPGDATEGPALAATGSDVSPLVWTGALALLIGGVALVLMRRRGHLKK